ncbi:MAG: DUF4276 family protein [Bacteroidales bacterium]|nr:DUF4276 family protein [Bacteroidales bacterium]
MRKLYIIVEGQTELEFVKQLLVPYFNNNRIYEIIPYCVSTSKTKRGGLSNYDYIKNDILRVLQNKHSDLVVTTIIDFFRIPNNFPNYNKAMQETLSTNKVSKLEVFFGKDIDDKRCIPYIQLHEFEALLYSSNAGFEKYEDQKIYTTTQKIIEDYENPEDINSNPLKSPSKRLLAIKPNYNKVFEGNIIALEIGIEKMIEKCPRFRNWISNLIIRIKE